MKDAVNLYITALSVTLVSVSPHLPPTGDNCYYCSQATKWSLKVLFYNGQVTGMDPNYLNTIIDLTCDPFNSNADCVEVARFIANSIWALGGYLTNPCQTLHNSLMCKLPFMDILCDVCDVCEILEIPLCTGTFVPPCRACHAFMECPPPSDKETCANCMSVMCATDSMRKIAPGCCYWCDKSVNRTSKNAVE